MVSNFVNVRQLGLLARSSTRAQFLFKDHFYMYSKAKNTWGKHLWIKGWSLTQIEQISKASNANRTLQNCFSEEISKLKAFTENCCTISAFTLWKGFYDFEECHYCARNCAIDWQHYCEDEEV